MKSLTNQSTFSHQDWLIKCKTMSSILMWNTKKSDWSQRKLKYHWNIWSSGKIQICNLSAWMWGRNTVWVLQVYHCFSTVLLMLIKLQILGTPRNSIHFHPRLEEWLWETISSYSTCKVLINTLSPWPTNSSPSPECWADSLIELDHLPTTAPTLCQYRMLLECEYCCDSVHLLAKLNQEQN